MKKRNKKVVLFSNVAMIVALLAIFAGVAIGWLSVSKAIDFALMVVGIFTILASYFSEPDDVKVFSFHIRAPTWLVFSVLFLAVPLPTMFLGQNSLLGLILTAIALIVLTAFCTWFSIKTKPR